MKHTHDYESVYRHGITTDLRTLGIQAAEVRKCKGCGREMAFILTKKGDWFPLFDENETSHQDILLS